ncbi:YihY family inner membrane protein [Derxia lacustris]|uniref:YihY family inner membrane protein n=1 Tax=Derxia lacustris TaxID=764842 RepID=UPI000A1740F6|nr:YihY family inner membrane protein [Derxia lacustris]
MTPSHPLPPLRRFVARLRRLDAATALAALRFAGRRLREERIADVAGSLTYTTVLSLVPLLTVALALFTAFPLFDQFRVSLQDWLVHNLLPDAISKGVMTYLNQFAAKAARISAVGGFFLVLTSMALLFTVDGAFNTIWRVREPRPLLQRLAMYWAVLTIGPLLLGASLTLTSVIVGHPRGRDDGLVTSLIELLPAAFSVAAFTFAYLVLPNKKVRLADALAGGVLAGIAFEVAKKLFALFITRFNTYTTVYGTFAAVPLFLLWVYLCWLITLFGAAMAATLPVLRNERWQRVPESGDAFLDAMAVLEQLWRAHRPASGSSAGASLDELRAGTRLGAGELEEVLARLVATGWVARLGVHAARAPVGARLGLRRVARDDERWALVVDARDIRVSEVFRAFTLMAAGRSGAPAAIRHAAEAVDAALATDLETWFSRPIEYPQPSATGAPRRVEPVTPRLETQ